MNDQQQTSNGVENRIDWWNLLFTLFFVLLSYLAFRWVVLSGTDPRTVSAWDAFIMLLATFRLTRLVVYDSITRWVRNFFENGKEYTFLGTLKTLVNCPWCMGLWFALIVATAYFVAPFFWFFIFLLALGGAASLLQIFANLVGWSAERNKQKALRHRDDD